TSIPSSIEIDVTRLEIGDNLHVRDLPTGDYEILTDPESAIAIVVPPTVQETTTEAEGDEAAAETADGEPEVISKGKEEKDEEGKSEEKKEKS
ncbi:MAG: 50S ribosomal protein L25/general stress protein Ctc, partial [Acidobacteriota bacterium]|nr:50S ribosomal protein L25/general stress protein Ctc [Acidobacteriota bacterium]